MVWFLLAGILAPEPTFAVVGAGDKRPVGQLVKLSQDFVASVVGRDGQSTVNDILSLRRTDIPVPSFPTGPHLITAGGDRIAGSLVGGDAQSLRFRPSGILMKSDQAWRVPLSAAAALWLKTTPADTPVDVTQYDWLTDVRNRDVLRFRNGDLARGTLDGMVPDAAKPTFSFRSEQGQHQSIRADELAVVVFNPTLARFRKPKGPYARVVLTDGSRLALIKPAVSSGLISGETLFGESIVVPLAHLVSLDVVQGKAVYLSDVKPEKVEQGGFVGLAWPWVADRTVRGTVLRLSTGAGESTFDKGLGTHPRTLLSYDLAGKYRRFEALVGLDPASGGRGRATVRVLVDGKDQTLPELAKLTSDTAVSVRVDVRGANELVLVVDYGPAGGVLADVNWVDARLVLE